MGNELYYIPSIKEFYIGFEYEQIGTGGKYISVIYEGQVLRKNYYYDEYESIEDLIEDGEIRVKHLDKDDIESLGFIYKKSTDLYASIKKIHLSDEFYLKKDIDLTYELLLYYNGDNTNIDICLFSQELCNNGEYSGDEYMYQISLNIKNKSELKIVLQQLNITEN